MIATAKGRGTQLQFKMVCGATPLARFARVSPSVRGRAAEGGRGSLKRHLESVYRLCPRSAAGRQFHACRAAR